MLVKGLQHKAVRQLVSMFTLAEQVLLRVGVGWEILYVYIIIE